MNDKEFRRLVARVSVHETVLVELCRQFTGPKLDRLLAPKSIVLKPSGISDEVDAEADQEFAKVLNDERALFRRKMRRPVVGRNR